MKNQNFKLWQLVKIVDIENLDLFNDKTNEQDIFLGDEFVIIDIEGEQDEQDLIVVSQRTTESLLMSSHRFVVIEDLIK